MIGAQLRGAGLLARGLAAWAGTARLSALPGRIGRVLDGPPLTAATPAGALFSLFVAGDQVPRGLLRGITDDAIIAMVEHGLLERELDLLRAPVAILPHGPPDELGPGRPLGPIHQALLVCDRLDAPVERDLVCWPDDSSYHLAGALPPGAQRADWLDLGCGSAFAPLARPGLAARITGIDINERAVRYAQLGVALSGSTHITLAPGDIAAPQPPAALVTCNAPIPDPAPELRPMEGDSPYRTAWQAVNVYEVWRRADDSFFQRLWPALRRAVRPGGMIVVHAVREAMIALEDAPGERVIVTYTPAMVRGFAVAWWRPDAPDQLVDVRRVVTADRPHIDARDRDDALAPAL